MQLYKVSMNILCPVNGDFLLVIYSPSLFELFLLLFLSGAISTNQLKMEEQFSWTSWLRQKHFTISVLVFHVVALWCKLPTGKLSRNWIMMTMPSDQQLPTGKLHGSQQFFPFSSNKKQKKNKCAVSFSKRASLF